MAGKRGAASLYSTRVRVRRSRTADNRGNLSEAYIDAVVSLYEGASLATQELDGQMLDDVEGALWSLEELDGSRELASLAAAPDRQGEDQWHVDAKSTRLGVNVTGPKVPFPWFCTEFETGGKVG